MKNPLIGTILKSLKDSYDKGDCDLLSLEELTELLSEIAVIKDKMEMKLDRVMTTEEVSLYLNVTRLTVKNYIDLGLLHPKKQLGGVLLFKFKEVKDLIKKLKLR